jgi:hypothetical protein
MLEISPLVYKFGLAIDDVTFDVILAGGFRGVAASPTSAIRPTIT